MEYKTLASPKAVREILASRNLALRKSLGQNFLIDANIQHRIVETADVDRRDVVLEIGPGLGALTETLIERAGNVVAIEYDRGLACALKGIIGDKSNFKLLNQDFLETDLMKTLDVYRKEAYHYKVVANLPYYITTPAIFKLIEAGVHWESMVFLVQKEVGDRICAGPGNKDYGALTVMLNFYGKPAKIMNVPRTVFYPTPRVDSAVIKITAQHLPADEEARRLQIAPYLRLVVQAAFGQRRKTILNALASLERYLGGKEERARILHKSGIDPVSRGETLSLQQFMDIADRIRLLDTKLVIP